MIEHMVHMLDLWYADPAMYFGTAGQDLDEIMIYLIQSDVDDLDHDLSDLSDVWIVFLLFAVPGPYKGCGPRAKKSKLVSTNKYHCNFIATDGITHENLAPTEGLISGYMWSS